MGPPPLPSGCSKHHIVYLQAVHCSLPDFSFPHTIDEYHNTSPAEVKERIKNATIVVSVIVPVLPSDMETAPKLQLLAVMATGMGWVDREYCASKDITVVNCPQSNVEAVGEHFLTLYFSSRRKIPELHRRVTETNQWAEKVTLTGLWPQGPPLSCAKEVLGIIGYGHLGKRFKTLAKAVGFGKIVIADRKGVEQPRDGRVTLNELFQTATTIVVCCPWDTDTIDLINEAEIALMKKECMIINMARGGIVNEKALADALIQGRIFAAATDVVDNEPSSPGSTPLVPDVSKGESPVPNLIITPHVAWYTQRTIEVLKQLLKDGLDSFVEGKLEDGPARDSVAVYHGKILK